MTPTAQHGTKNRGLIALHPRHGDALAMASNELRHQYIVMRHGFSVPNEAKQIVSSLEKGTLETFGLTAVGRQQAIESGGRLGQFLANSLKAQSRRVVFVSSPFSRAVQTAELAKASLTKAAGSLLDIAPSVHVEPALRERFFGTLDGTSDANYSRVWERDAADGDAQKAFDAESCLEVWLRVVKLISSLEARLTVPHTIVLVSHGDTLQITQTALADSGRLALASHRSLPPLMQAEWRVVAGPSLNTPPLSLTPSSKL